MNRATDPDLWSPDLEFLLCQADSAMGNRGTLAAVVSAIERGGVGGSSDLNLSMLARIGWPEDVDDQGKARPKHQNVERVRRLRVRWGVLAFEHQRVAVVHYMPIKASDPVVQRLGNLAGACVLLAPSPEALLRACELPNAKGSPELRAAALERGERGVRALHRAWAAGGQREADAWAEGA